MVRFTSLPRRIFLLFVLLAALDCSSAQGIIGVNWGTIASQPLPPQNVVQLLKDNNFTKVKLFDANKAVLTALEGTGFEVMVAAPNDMLQTLQDPDKARDWVKYNISFYRQKNRVNIAYAAIGNEPFLSGYLGAYVPLVLPALQNVQQAINEQKLQGIVKVVVPMNADVMISAPLPSQTFFKPEYVDLMTRIVGLLKQYGSPFIVNLYPYLSLYQDKDFPLTFAFFGQDNPNPLIDGVYVYKNVLEASLDCVANSLAAVGAPNMPIVLGEVGWPTDGERSANIEYAQRFNQGLLDHMMQRLGTPRFPNTFFDFYLFGLLDEDAKSVLPGNFERHWGVFNYAGQLKYTLDLSGRRLNYNLVPARNVKYLPSSWCVARQGAETSEMLLQRNIEYACERADCTPLQGSCANLTDIAKASFAFNSYYQANRQVDGSCDFEGLATTTKSDPTKIYGSSCPFQVEVDARSSSSKNSSLQEKRPSSSPGPEPNLATNMGASGAGFLAAFVGIFNFLLSSCQ